MKKLKKIPIIKIALVIFMTTGQPFFLMGYSFMKEIKLGKSGKVALVNDEDFVWLNKVNWYYHSPHKGLEYAKCGRTQDEFKKHAFMHRVILNVVDRKVLVDHGDHNGLNNQRTNIRTSSALQNNRNCRKRDFCSSVFKGVSFNKAAQKFIVRIAINGKYKPTGRFENEIEAAKNYNENAKKHYGEFAFLNKIPDGVDSE